MYRVGVIGLGSIAARYSTPSDAHPYCHVGGIRLCDATELVAVADMSAERRDEFAKTWGPVFPDGFRYYETDREMLENEQLDIVAVCVRGPFHFAVMQKALKADIRAIFLEKPAGCSLHEVDEMTRIAESRGIPTVVDYSRHWAPHLIRLQSLVADGLVGQVQSVIGYCGGTILSFAIHTTDLICQFAGYDPISVAAHISTGGGEMPAGYEPEPAIVGASIRFASGVQGFHVGNHGKAPAFAVDVLGTEGQLRCGIYTGTVLLDKDGKRVDNATLDLPPNESVFKVAYQQIADHLGGGPAPHCSGADYMAVNEIGFATIESGLTGETVAIPCARRDRLIWANG